MKKLIYILLVLVLAVSSVNILASAYDELPAPDWVTVTTNPDSSKTLSFTTPTYMIDKVDYYEYSTDSFLTVEKLSNTLSGEFVFDKTTEFSLRYYSEGMMSKTFVITVTVNKTTIITSDSTNISILIPFDSPMPTDIALSAFEITGGNDYNTAKNTLGNNKSFRLFNISVMRNNKEYKTDIPYHYMFPCEKFSPEYTKIYTMDSRGKLTQMDSRTEINALVCKTEKTGLFLIVEDKAYCPGDLSGDGKVQANDARIALRISAKIETPTLQQCISGDVNKNGFIEAADARLILRASASLEKL